MADELLTADRLVVAYSSAPSVPPILKEVSLSIARGEMLGVVGESGSGKTTLGRTLLGLVASRSGTIRFAGTDITNLGQAEMRPFRRRMQMIFQDPMSSLNPRHKIRRILTMPLMLHGLAHSKREAERLVNETIDKVGLPSKAADRYPHELSGGQRQRLGIARAVLLKPEFILADEIVSGLDVSTQAQVLNLIISLQKEMGLAMAFISHDLSVIRNVCDRVMIMRAGAVVEEGRCGKIFEAPQAAYTRSLIEAIPLPVYDPHYLN